MPTDNIVYIACAMAALFILAFFFRPFRFLFRAALRSLLGLFSLFVASIAGGYVGISIGINAVNAILAASLGIPGVVTLLAVQGILG